MPSKQAVDYCADYLTQVVQYVSQVTLPRQYGKQFLQNQQISYVITVPAIWSDKAKELTRQVTPSGVQCYLPIFLWFLVVDILFSGVGKSQNYCSGGYSIQLCYFPLSHLPFNILISCFYCPLNFLFPFHRLSQFGINFRRPFAQEFPAENSC
jgi:hypothetical protein